MIENAATVAEIACLNSDPLCHRYALNIGFNLLNKSIFKYYPFPYTVSAVHVVVGLIYCVIVYAIGLKKLSFGRVSLIRAVLLAFHLSVQ